MRKHFSKTLQEKKKSQTTSLESTIKKFITSCN